MIVKRGKKFKKNNVYTFGRRNSRAVFKYTYMLCILCDKNTACLVPIHGKGEECEENCYTLDMDKPELFTNDIPLNDAIDIKIYGYAAEGQYWSYESV